MKKLFVILGFIGVINVAALNSSAKLPNPRKNISDDHLTGILSAVTPLFTQLDGNLFLAIQTQEPIEVTDGTAVEFVFDENAKVISFHINDANQNLINTGVANLFVMIHHDLALKLRSTRLKEINVLQGKNVTKIPVDRFWIPSQNLINL